MRVLLVSQYFWPERFGINDIVVRLLDSGVDVDVITGRPNYPDGKFFDGYGCFRRFRDQVGGATVFRVPIVPRGVASRVRLALNYVSFVISAIVFSPILVFGRRYDVVFAYVPSPVLAAIPALFLGRLKRANVVIWVQDLWPGSIDAVAARGGKRLGGVLAAIVRWIYRRTDRILISSHAFRQSVLETLGDPGQAQKVEYHPNTFDPGADRERTGVQRPLPEFQCEFPVVFTGNVGRAQALATILDSAKYLESQPKIRIFLVGGGSMVAYAREQIAVKGIENVVMCGQYPVFSMPEILSRASALLVTLNADGVFEHTVPSKVQAYLSAGKPIVAGVSGETARLIQQAGAGVVCPAEDAEALAGAIMSLFRLPAAELAKMGCNGQAYFREHFDPEVVSDKLLQILRREAFGEMAGMDESQDRKNKVGVVD